MAEQLRLLSQATEKARERNISYLEVRRMPDEAGFRELAGVEPDEFAVVMVRDGEAVRRWQDVTEPQELWTAFDDS